MEKGRARVTAFECLQRGRNEQVSLGDTVEVAVFDEPSGAGQPPARTGHLSLEQEPQRQPERATGGLGGIIEPETLEVRAFPGVRALGVPTDEVGGDGQPLEILGIERTRRPAASSAT